MKSKDLCLQKKNRCQADADEIDRMRAVGMQINILNAMQAARLARKKRCCGNEIKTYA